MKRLLFLICCTCLLISSCGYYNPYVVNADSKPISIHRSMWANQTSELGLETVLYHSLSSWLRRTELINLKEQNETAQYKLVGEITAITYPEIAYGGNNIASELRINLTIHYKLIETASNNFIMEETKTFIEPFSQGATPSSAQINKNIALAEIADNISEEIYLKLINKVIRK